MQEKELQEKIRKASEKYERIRNKKHLHEKHEAYERRKWKKNLEEYNRANRKNVEFCYETSENKRYSVHRGVHTIEYIREYMQEPKKIQDIIEKNKIILVFGKDKEKCKGILKLATRVKKLENREYSIKIREIPEEFVAKKKSTLEIPEVIEIEGNEYFANDIRKILIEKNAMVFEM